MPKFISERAECVKKSSRIVFTVVLGLFVTASVYMSFNVISRPTFEYEEQADIGGTGISGTVFCGFNGNSGTAKVRVYHPMVKNANRSSDADIYIEDLTRTVAGIDEFTFVSDENMQYCYIGPDVAYIDERAFFGCFALKAIIVDPENDYYTDIDGVLYTKDLSELLLYPTNHITYLNEIGKVEPDYYENNPEVYAVPEGVRRIATGCFYKVWGIRNITFPSTLKEIGDMTFFKCESLELVTLPEGLEKLGSDSFSYCKSMKYAMYIPLSVSEVGHHCFYKCDGLEKFYLAAAGEDDVILGGRWQPKNENKFSSELPLFGASRADADAYNAQKLESESSAAAAQNDA